MTQLLLLLAQSDPTGTLAGSSGWLGAGLLGLVLCWLCFFHLPAKDKQIKEFIDGKDAQLAAKDKQLAEFMEAKDAHIETMAVKFKEALDAVIASHKAEMEWLRKNA